MRKIYKFNNDKIETAWIGGTAPVPDGWYLDVNEAREQHDLADVIEVMPKRRGRPPKDKV